MILPNYFAIFLTVGRIERRIQVMGNIIIDIPEEIILTAKIPRKNFEKEVKKELAIQLYREGIISYSNARRLSNLSKLEFHFLLGERKIPRQYDFIDYEKDLAVVNDWEETE